jgi:hypothetical protein
MEMSFVRKLQFAHNERFSEFITQFMEINWDGKDFKEIKERVYEIEYIMGSTLIAVCSEILFNSFIMFMIFYESLIQETDTSLNYVFAIFILIHLVFLKRLEYDVQNIIEDKAFRLLLFKMIGKFIKRFLFSFLLFSYLALTMF